MQIDKIGVLLFGYNRPEMLKNRIQELERIKIENLLISIDGGPKSHTKEMSVVKKIAKKRLKNVRNLRIVHYEKNLGMVNYFNIAMNKILKNMSMLFLSKTILHSIKTS